MIYWLHLVGAPLARRCPIWFCYWVASIIAPLVFFLWREKRENAIENMTHVLGPGATVGEARRLAMRAFVNYAKYLIDMMRLQGFTGRGGGAGPPLERAHPRGLHRPLGRFIPGRHLSGSNGRALRRRADGPAGADPGAVLLAGTRHSPVPGSVVHVPPHVGHRRRRLK